MSFNWQFSYTNCHIRKITVAIFSHRLKIFNTFVLFCLITQFGTWQPSQNDSCALFCKEKRGSNAVDVWIIFAVFFLAKQLENVVDCVTLSFLLWCIALHCIYIYASYWWRNAMLLSHIINLGTPHLTNMAWWTTVAVKSA